MAWRQRIGDSVERNVHGFQPARDEGLGLLASLAMGEIEETSRQKRGGSVRRDRAKAHGHGGQRPVSRELEDDCRRTEDFHPALERGHRKAERAGIIIQLAGWELALVPRTPRTGVGAAALRAGDTKLEPRLVGFRE